MHADAEFFGYALGSIGVQTGVEVHGDLDPEDESEDGPFLPTGEAETELLVTVGLGQLDHLVSVGVVGSIFLVVWRSDVLELCRSIFGVGRILRGISGTACGVSQLAVVGGEVGSQVCHGDRLLRPKDAMLQ